jgi:hypothetical protein
MVMGEIELWRLAGAPIPMVALTNDGNGQGMGRVEQYHIHTRIVNGYKLLPIPIPMGIKLYPYPYPVGTRTHWVPGG